MRSLYSPKRDVWQSATKQEIAAAQAEADALAKQCREARQSGTLGAEAKLIPSLTAAKVRLVALQGPPSPPFSRWLSKDALKAALKKRVWCSTMGNIKAFIRQLNGGSEIKKVAWSTEDVARWREIYGVTEKEAAVAIEQAARTRTQQIKVSKFATDSELPTKWSFTASDGKVDRDFDIVSVAGIKLDEFAKNPLWHWQHLYHQPIGVSPKTFKEGGKLKSVSEPGIGVYEPTPRWCRGLSLRPKQAYTWLPALALGLHKSRDGVDFDEMMLTEISACSLAACPGADSMAR